MWRASVYVFPLAHASVTLARRLHPRMGSLGKVRLPPATNRASNGGPRQGWGERAVRSLGFGQRIRALLELQGSKRPLECPTQDLLRACAGCRARRIGCFFIGGRTGFSGLVCDFLGRDRRAAGLVCRSCRFCLPARCGAGSLPFGDADDGAESARGGGGKPTGPRGSDPDAVTVIDVVS